MEFGVHSIDFLPGDPATLGPTQADAAKAAERGGATVFTLTDHFFQMEALGRAEDPFLEGYTSLGFLAERTTIDLTLLVTGVISATPACWPKRSPRLTCCLRVGLCWEWAPRGTTANISPRHSLSAAERAL
jgi:hypothetical protein